MFVSLRLQSVWQFSLDSILVLAVILDHEKIIVIDEKFAEEV